MEERLKRVVVFAIPAFFLLSACFSLLPLTSPGTSATSGDPDNTENILSLRVLDDTATTEITQLSFGLRPMLAGESQTKRAVVDVSTTNPGGYKLYVESNAKDSSGEYTTNLVYDDATKDLIIPTSVEQGITAYWNYVNPLLGAISLIPAHGAPDQIDVTSSATDSRKTNIDVTVSADSTIEPGIYKNQLLFTAIANPNPINYSLIYESNLPSAADPSSLEDLPESETISTLATSHIFSISSTTPSLRGYDFVNYLGSDGNSYNPGDEVTLDSTNPRLALLANWGVNIFTLTVNPNGGVWNDNVNSQTFAQEFGSTRTISTPSKNAAYTITYDDNSQNATYNSETTKASRDFIEWELTGAGSFDGTDYTFSDGAGTLTAKYNDVSNEFTLPTIEKVGHSCKWAEGSTGGTQYSGGTIRTITSNTTYYAVCTANPYSLTVEPKGGVWEGGASERVFTQDYGTTKSISDPTSGPSYAITYNANNQNASYTGTPTSVERPFDSWSKYGAGTFADGTYTFGAGDGTLSATYNLTSNSFTLPLISKAGHSCKWAEGSASGTQYTGGTSRTITSDTTYYAVCTVNQYTLTINPTGGKWNNTTSTSTVDQNYGGTSTIADATDGPTYTISYDMGSTGVTKPTSPTSVARSFSGWSLTKTGGGSSYGSFNISTKVYTFGAGNDTLSANWYSTSNTFTLPTLSKSGHTCKWHLGSTSGAEYASSATGVTITENSTFYAACTANPYTLTVNPNGGTWSGSGFVNNQKTQDYGTTVTVPNPTAGPSYTISYDMGSTGITKPTSPTSVQRPFSSWSLSGSGSFVNGTYTYSAGNGTLTASYSSTSNGFTLPSISKAGNTCVWHIGSASGTQYASGATNVKISENSTFYATCSVNNYTVNISNSNTTSGASSLSVPYGGSKTVTVTPNSGYYLTAVSCPSGYSCTGYSVSGYDTTGTQTVTVTNNSTTSGGTVTFTATSRPTLSQACNSTATQGTFTYGGTLYVKLKTNAGGTTTACYTRNYVAQVPYSEAASKCPSGTGIPTKTDYDALITAYGSGGDLWAASGFSDGGFHWSSTEYQTGRMYFLVLWSTGAVVGNTSPGDVANSNLVTCIVR